MKLNLRSVFMLAACTLCMFAAKAQPWLGSQNPMATYYQAKGWPAWSDAINWANRVNMATYTNGANDFEKFENARDALFAQGGGVLYYPAGTYNFSNHPTGPNTGRGLMLKAGVVILGEEPTASKEAVLDSVTPGLSTLGTKFLFPFVTKTSVNAGGGTGTGEVPEIWNMIGLYADATTKITDTHHVGIAWVNVVGGYVFFGPELDWAGTWGDLNADAFPLGSYRKARWSLNPGETVSWNERVPNGQHPGDCFFGALETSIYHPTKGGRFVFGCRFDDCAVTDDFMETYKTTKVGTITTRTDSVDAGSYHTYRFAARLNLDGANVFIGNNALTQSTKNFYYNQKIQRAGQSVPGSPFQVKTILFDYGKQGGIDVNKSLVSRATNRCNYNDGPFVEENIVVKDNFVFSHGHKGFEMAGKWMICQNNYNSREFLQEGDDIYNLGSTGQSPSYELTLDGISEAGPNSDNLSRAFDMGGWCVWTDRNWYQGTGSAPGNDGEGILYQPQGGIGFLSVAETFNRQGATGKSGYIAPYDTPVYGMLQAWNTQRGGVGINKVGANRVEDAVVVRNFLPGSLTPSSQSGSTGTNIGDLTFTCPSTTMTAPDSVMATADSIKACIIVKWKDASTNEIGFRVERAVGTSTDYTVVAYRPAHVTGSDVANFSILDNGVIPPACANQGAFDLNPQVWYDYLAVPGESYTYRVVAIDCSDDNAGASAPTATLTAPVVTSLKDAKLATTTLKVYPNPANSILNISLPSMGATAQPCTIYDVHGRVVGSYSLKDFNTSVNISILAPGLYRVVSTDGTTRRVAKFVKQ